MAAKYSLTMNSHKNKNEMKEHSLSYMLMSNKSSPCHFLARYESPNLHVKMVKKHLYMALIALSSLSRQLISLPECLACLL